MGMDNDRVITGVAHTIEVAGIAVLVAGGILATLAFPDRIMRRRPFTDSYR